MDNDVWLSIKRHLPDDVLGALDNGLVTDISLNPNGRCYAIGFLPKIYLGDIPSIEIRKFIKKIADHLNSTITVDRPYIDGYISSERLRIEGTIPPASLAPGMSIRKLATEVYSLESYVENGILKSDGFEILCSAISNYANIVVAGATGAGKTTLTNALLDQIFKLCPDDRIISIEDTQELIISSLDRWEHYTSANFTARENVKRSLRKTPKRVIVGESRDEIILDILNIWNTGHSGGMTTLHAGRTPWKSFKNISQSEMAIDVLERIEDMASLGGLVTDQTRRTISKSVDLIVSIERYSFDEACRRAGTDNPSIGDQIQITSITELINFDMSLKSYNYNLLYTA